MPTPDTTQGHLQVRPRTMPARSLLMLSLFLAITPSARAETEPLLQLLQHKHCAQCNLKDADLVHADLRNADLKAAQLQRANLSRARLDGADLSKSDLSFTSLQGASLRGADLRGSTLYGTDLILRLSILSKEILVGGVTTYCLSHTFFADSAVHFIGDSDAAFRA